MTAVPTTASTPVVRRLSVETGPLDDTRPLIPFADPHAPLVWSRNGRGLVGIGVAARLEFRGASRMRDAAEAWRGLAARTEVTDRVRVAGTGLVAFGTFSFSPASRHPGVLIVPRVVIGRSGDRTWITHVRDLDAETGPDPAAVGRRSPGPDGDPHPLLPTPIPLGDEYRIGLRPGALTPDGYRRAVDAAIGRIRSTGLRKVVLARDAVGHLPLESDLRRVLVELSLGYPDCWTYAVDGLVGASPETLIRVREGRASARVLAGTVSRGQDAAADHEAALGLAMSRKDQDEHAYAVQSVSDSLRPHVRDLTTSEPPFTLKLPNLWHLATDVSATLADGSSSLDLIDALHPTAAVAGTPTELALAAIHELEPFDRGRYAGPVGWVDANGDGEWAIALRGAQVGPAGDITAYAGAGIVEGSDPDRELAETAMKFRPIVEAFG